jgi:predicted  nucleic acid-binding Zn-ribbon protein
MPRPRGSNLSDDSLKTGMERMVLSTPPSPSVNSQQAQTHSSDGRSRRALPQSPQDIAKYRVQQFRDSLSEPSAKKLRLENANKIVKLERQRQQLINRIKKHKQRIREAMTVLEEEEEEKAAINQQITLLKASMVDDDD